MTEAKHKSLRLERARKVMQLRHLMRAMAWLRRSGPVFGDVWNACMARKKRLRRELGDLRRALRQG